MFLDQKAQQEHDETKEAFDLLNDQLIGELPQLLDLRVPYFDPSFEAMIRMQCKFAEEGYEKMSGVQRYVNLLTVHHHLSAIYPVHRYFADNVRDDYAAGQLDAQVHTFLLVVTRADHFVHRLKVCYRRCGTCQYVGETDPDP